MKKMEAGVGYSFVSAVVYVIFQQIKRHMRYAFIYKKNVDKFEEKLKMLIAERASVQQEVDAAESNGERIKAVVELWCETVDRVINEEVKEVKDLEDKTKNKCFIGLCPNIKSFYQLSRKAEEGAAAVDDLIQRGKFDRVGYRDVPEAILDASPKGFETFKSREKVFNGIMEAMKDAAISMIGVHGMGGVGKTSLVKEVARKVIEVKLFDSVVIAHVTQTPDIRYIQDQIADLLGLRLEEKSTVGRAYRLREGLKKEKCVLVVLDDIWERLDLEEVGIPFGNQHKGCKILLTSRVRNVLSVEMDAQKTFPIGVLDEEEAWDLFRKMAGIDGVESAMLQSTAIEVAKKCAGLPLAIGTVARALRNKSLFVWKDALRQLQRPSSNSFTGISSDVYSAIKFSYNYLGSEELKQVFLLCSLLHRDARIDYLLRNAIGLALINGVNTVEEARNKLLTMVSKLKAYCLLRDSNINDQCFDMHDVVYDVAMSMDNHVFALNEEDVLKDWPDGETMKRLNKIHLRDLSIFGELPDELNCPQLVFFKMSSKDRSLTIPPNFFSKTANLKVLELTNMHFLSLPSSICLLTSLRTLCLDQCELENIPIIGELRNLEILSLSHSNIVMLPKEIRQLTKLRLLDLSDCIKLKIIPSGVLLNLSKLEELYMGQSFDQWNQGSNALLSELKYLSCLITLDVCILDVKIVPEDLFFEKLERYKILIGDTRFWNDENEYSRALKLKVNTSIDHLDVGMKRLLKKTEALYLEDLEGVKIVLNDVSNREGFLHLSHLHIQDASEIQHIMKDNDAIDKITFHRLRSLTLERLPQLIGFCSKNRSGGSTSTPQHDLALFSERATFPCLEELRLSKLPKLTHLLKEEVQPGFVFQNLRSLELQGCGGLKNLGSASVSFENLTILEVSMCHGLENLLKPSTAKSLVQLKRMSIADCRMIKEIIGDLGYAAEISIEFSGLKFLRLKYLPNLTSFCSGNYDFEFPSLDELIVEECPELKVFSQGYLSTPLLPRVRTAEGGNVRCEAGLNTTIRKMYTEAKAQNHVKELGFPRWSLQELWKPW